jgi:hypothetical protein
LPRGLVQAAFDRFLHGRLREVRDVGRVRLAFGPQQRFPQLLRLFLGHAHLFRRHRRALHQYLRSTAWPPQPEHVARGPSPSRGLRGGRLEAACSDVTSTYNATVGVRAVAVGITVIGARRALLLRGGCTARSRLVALLLRGGCTARPMDCLRGAFVREACVVVRELHDSRLEGRFELVYVRIVGDLRVFVR